MRLMEKRLLVVEPSERLRNALKERLAFEGFSVDPYPTLREGCMACEHENYDILLCDQGEMEPHFMYNCKEALRNINIVVMSPVSATHGAVRVKECRTLSFVSKPIDMNQLLATIRVIARTTEEQDGPVWPVNGDVLPCNKQGSAGKSATTCWGVDLESIIGISNSISQVKSLINRAGPSEARVLITGPSGTGKELVARCLHQNSRRCTGPFVELNCAAIPEELIESELFGHEKGSFTSAMRQYKGKFEQAADGTLFMDEIGDMSLAAQAKMLRALQEGKITRVGGDRDIEVDVRIIAATNKNLREEILRGNFRGDLYHRLGVIIINVPSLAERKDDIPLLVDHFVKEKCTAYGITPKQIDDGAIRELQTMDWDGNIRELQNVVERLIVLGEAPRISADDVRTYALCM